MNKNKFNEYLEAINVGANLEHVWRKWMIWVLTDKDHGVIRFSREQDKQALWDVVNVLQKQSEGHVFPAKQLEAVRKNAWDTRYAAAYAVAAAARRKHYKIMADKLLELLRGEKGGGK